MKKDNGSLVVPLKGRGEKLVAANVAPDEKFLVKLPGMSSEALVATDRRLYVVKWGFLTGNTFGGRCTAFEYGVVSGIEIRKNLVTGIVQIVTPGNQESGRGYWGKGATSSLNSDSIVNIGRTDFEIFQEAVNLCRGLISDRHGISHGMSSDTYGLAQIEKLGELRDKGLITNEEFEAKKKQILSL